MADYMRRQQHRQNREKDMIIVENYSCSIISDEEASKIHGLGFENNCYSSDSDSGKSSFDEEFFKNKPGPMQISRSNIVTIKPISSPNRQLQDPNQALGKDEFLKKNFYEYDGANHQLPTNSVHTINTPIQQDSNGFSSGDKHNSKEITAYAFNTNCLIPKGLLNNIQGVYQTTRAEKDCSVSEYIARQNYHSAISSETAYPINIQDKVIPSNRKPSHSSYIGGDIERPGTSQITTATRSDKDLIVVKQNVRNVPKISSQTASNTSSIPKRSAMDPVHGIARQDYHSVISSGTGFPVYIQDKVVPSRPRQSSRKQSYSSSIGGDIERPRMSQITTRTGLDKDVIAAKQNVLSVPKISSQTSSNSSLRPKRSARDTVRSSNYNINTSDLPNVIARAPSRTSTRNAPKPLPPQRVQIASNHRDLLREQPSGNEERVVIPENNSETVGLFEESNGNCCGRFIDFLCCRKC